MTASSQAPVAEIVAPFAVPDGAVAVWGGGRVEELEDGALAVRFSAGDEAALEEAYRRWSRLVYTVALRSTGNREDAADVTQVTFVSAWRGRSGFDPAKGVLPAWLMSIARRRIADHWEDRSRDARRTEAADRKTHV